MASCRPCRQSASAYSAWSTRLRESPSRRRSGVNADDPQRQHLPFLDDFFGVIDAAIGQFRDVDQPFDLVVVLDPRERAELGQLGDRAFDELADLVAILNQAPRVWLPGA